MIELKNWFITNRRWISLFIFFILFIYSIGTVETNLRNSMIAMGLAPIPMIIGNLSKWED